MEVHDIGVSLYNVGQVTPRALVDAPDDVVFLCRSWVGLNSLSHEDVFGAYAVDVPSLAFVF